MMIRNFLSPILLLTLLTVAPPPAWPAAAEIAPRSVGVRNLDEIAVFPRRSAPATVVSLNDSRLSSEIRARIQRIPVLAGQTVKPGETLVEFA